MNSESNQIGHSQRLLSLDALRGFDMLLIAGGGQFISRLYGVTGIDWVDTVAAQLTHPAWHGFTFYDFIFPLFLFLAGVSLSYSLSGAVNKGIEKKVLYRKVFKRMLILMVLGIMDKNMPVDIFNPSNIRFGTVLGKIGIATFFGAVFYLNFTWMQRVGIVASILLLYYAAIFLIPVPGYGAGDISFEGNLVGWFDRTFMPGRLLQKTYDENALLTQLPGMCLTIIGTLAGDVLRSLDLSESTKLQRLVFAGIVCIAIALLWDLHFPINKHLWSSSFIMLTAGMSFLFLALFYGIIDVLGYSRWSFFFKVIGMNSLVVYLAYHFINFDHTSRIIFGGLYQGLDEKWHPSLTALGSLVLVWLMLYFLYKKKIFVRV